MFIFRKPNSKKKKKKKKARRILCKGRTNLMTTIYFKYFQIFEKDDYTKKKIYGLQLK